MDHHSWRPHPNPIPIQGNNNICPTCSISHFPFCPPSRYTLNSGRTPPNNNEPRYDPGYWNRNPSLSFPEMGDSVNVNKASYSMQNPAYTDSGVVGNHYNNITKNNDGDDVNNHSNRNSKRLRVDGMYSVRSCDGSTNSGPSTLPNVLPEENERRLRLIRDHGGPNLGGPVSCTDVNVRGYGQESLIFDRSVDDVAVNVGMRNNLDVGYGTVNHQRQELGYQSGYGMKRSTSDVVQVQHGSMGSMFPNHDQHLSKYGQGGKQPDSMAFNQGGIGHDRDSQSHGFHYLSYGNGSSHVPNESVYGSNLEPMHSINAAHHYDPTSNMSMPNNYFGNQPPLMQQPDQMRYGYHSPTHFNGDRLPFEARAWPVEGYHRPFGDQNIPMRPYYGTTHMENQGCNGNSVSDNMGQVRASQGLDVRPPVMASPPPPLPVEPLGHWSADNRPSSSSPKVSSSLFPVPVSSSATFQSSYVPNADSLMRTHQHLQNSQLRHPSRGMSQTDSQANLPSSRHYLGEAQPVSSTNNFPDKAKVIDASHLFKPPHRATRSSHFVIILRGLPGSGKSYLAKMLRDLEVEHGGNAPRIHSMDDYFMTEVEKADENEASKSSLRGKKPTMKKVLEFCYEPEMEEAYRASMLKSFKKTLEEGVFTFVIVDDRNLRVADFAQFWATAKRLGYEVYLLEAPYKDLVGCTARNIHGFAHDDVEKMAAQWEEAPSLYVKLDVKSLFHGDDLSKGDIQEVDMDTEDGDVSGTSSTLEERKPEKIFASSGGDLGSDVSLKDGRSYSDADGDNPTEEVKHLGQSKWSTSLDEEDDEKTKESKGKPNVLSGLLRTYVKEGKSVHWGDQGGHTGFSIGAVKKANATSLVIGPGRGYNLKSNPLPDEQAAAKSGETKMHSMMFKERLRAEQESFKAVFDRRRQRHRIGGFDAEDD